jgi:hypothetical protein
VCRRTPRVDQSCLTTIKALTIAEGDSRGQRADPRGFIVSASKPRARGRPAKVRGVCRCLQDLRAGGRAGNQALSSGFDS